MGRVLLDLLPAVESVNAERVLLEIQTSRVFARVKATVRARRGEWAGVGGRGRGKGKEKYRWRGLGYGEGEGEAAFHFHFCMLRDARVFFFGQTSKCTQRCLLRVISFNSMEGERQTDRQT